MNGKYWTDEEIEILRSAKNKNRIKIPGRSKASIRIKLRKLCIVEPCFKIKKHEKRAWNEEEIKILRDALDKRNLKLPNRTRYSIINKLRSLNLIKKNEPRKHWLKKHEELLRRMVIKEKKSARQIFAMNILPHSRNSIQKKMCSMGLAKKMQKPVIFSKPLNEKFKKFLSENWEKKTPSDLVDIWNEKETVKVNKRKVIRYLTILDLKISYGEVQSINNLRKKEEEIRAAHIGEKTSKILMDSIRMARAEFMRKRFAKKKDIWTGLPIKENVEEEQILI